MDTVMVHENLNLYRKVLMPTLCIDKDSKLVDDISVYVGLNNGVLFENRKNAARMLINRVIDAVFDKEIIAFASSYSDEEISEYKKDIIKSFNKLAIDNESLDKEVNSILKDANLAVERELRVENIKRDLVFNSEKKYDKGGILYSLNNDSLKDSLKDSIEVYNGNVTSEIQDESEKNRVNDLGKEVIKVINKDFDSDIDKTLDKIEEYLSFVKNDLNNNGYDLEKASRKKGKHFSKEDYEEMLRKENLENNNSENLDKLDEANSDKVNHDEIDEEINKNNIIQNRNDNKKENGFLTNLLLKVANKFSKTKNKTKDEDNFDSVEEFIDLNEEKCEEENTQGVKENIISQNDQIESAELSGDTKVFDSNNEKNINNNADKNAKYKLVKTNDRKKTDKKVSFFGKPMIATAAIVLGTLFINSCTGGFISDKIKKIVPPKDNKPAIEQTSENATVIYEKRASEVAKGLYSEYGDVLSKNGYTDVDVEEIICKLNGLNTVTNISIKEVDDFMNVILNEATVNPFNTKEAGTKEVTLSQMLIKNQNGTYFVESVENDLNTMIKNPKNVDEASKDFYKTVYRAYNDELSGINLGKDDEKNSEVDYMFVKISEFANLFASENANLQFEVNGVKHSSYDYSGFDLYDGSVNKYLKQNGYVPKTLVKTK